MEKGNIWPTYIHRACTIYSSCSSFAGRSWVIKIMAVLFNTDHNEESFELSLSYRSPVPLLTNPQTQFPLSTQRSCRFLLHLPKKRRQRNCPPSLLAFLHVSSLQCKLKVGRWPIFQCQDMHLCQDMHPCLICSCTSASTQAPRCAFAPGECRYWCTLNSRHFTCDYYLCTQRCSCAIIIAHHMLSFWYNPQLRCPHFFASLWLGVW